MISKGMKNKNVETAAHCNMHSTYILNAIKIKQFTGGPILIKQSSIFSAVEHSGNLKLTRGMSLDLLNTTNKRIS